MTLRLPFELNDLVSPMLVKELRQGLRARVFVVPFLVMCAALCLGVGFCLYESGTGADTNTSRDAFWILAGGPIVACCLPAFASFRQDRRNGCYELSLVTEMTPWRILLGMWTSYALRSALLASLVLPFVVVRYYLGGVELLDETERLSGILSVSFLCAAVGLATTGYQPSLGRILRAGCLGLVALPVLACFMGALLYFTAWFLFSNTMGAVNASLLSLCILNWGARELSPEAARQDLLTARTAYWFMMGAAALTQLAAHWPPLYIAAVPLDYLAVAKWLERDSAPPLLLVVALPFPLRARARGVVVSGFILLQLLWLVCHPLPSPPHFVLIALAGGIILPWALNELFSRWTEGNEVFNYVAAQLVMLSLCVIMQDSWAAGLLPTTALALSLGGVYRPEWLPLTAAITAAAVLALLHRLRPAP